MSQDRDTLYKIADDLQKHQIADESFQNATQIHQLEMKKAQAEMTEAIKELKDVMKDWVKITSSLSVSGKILLKAFGIVVAIAAGIAALKYLIVGILSGITKF